MNIIDLSHIISPDIPIYPGDLPPEFINRAEIDEDGFYERIMTISTHVGTHMDAPAHVIPHAPTLDRLPIDRFMGRASVIDLTGLKYSGIDISYLESHESLFRTSEFILLYTGWSRFWGQKEYFGNYPVLSLEAALWIDSFGLKGIGIDTISVDEIGATDLAVHKILLERMVIIENLTNLDKLPETGFTFSCLPLKLENADASPIRAVAIV